MKSTMLLLLSTLAANALEISPDAYKPVQWIPPPGTYMPIPPPPPPDYYREWREWGGQQTRPDYDRRGAMCAINVQGRTRYVPCAELGR